MAATATLEQIRAGLVANLSSLGIQSKGYVLGAPTAPAIEVFPGEMNYDLAMGRGVDELMVTVRVTVSIALDVAAQMQLDEYLEPSGATSVKTLLEADKTLGGAVNTLRVVSASGYQTTQLTSGGVALSCDWQVRILV